MARLVVNDDHSWCVACGGGADPTEKAHDTLLGESGLAPGARGCGETFTEFATESFALQRDAEALREWRPDIPFVGIHGAEVHD